ncbi:MAG TPA: acetyl-CoA carboxylase biotin carboxylase subunit [Verrucomicrobiales bacterium]|nr:acetyl-CoA carboxylase biotin carboxylase subunit [Verrucomicrobiae bacterium]MCP5554756.1 acetyl-CoA carboxylase biotin carboxylase subunit [Akkermansiaceae bacterium]HRX54225.1 acetyl-CoA carboxylase biotin carboxylase subunit [Verrucomicrobiales bacterium]
MFKKILVANRGEIALRVIRACKELGVRTVAVYAEPDVDSMHVQLADDAICIGPAASHQSYLKTDRIMAAAEIANVDAIHPGYGFLSENPRFAEICESCKVKFIGPSAEVIAMMGDKNQARATAKKFGIPITPGSDGVVKNEEEAIRVADEIGYPIMIKASAGGGGRGMRPVLSPASLMSSFHAARAEAEACFGVPDVYFERLIENPHHIEFQVVADRHGNVIELGERDCSIQRRNQKIIEETPSPMLSEGLRQRMAEASVTLTRQIGYENCGTIEYLVDDEENFYFMEMNTRIQVEHPITEEVRGCDLIKEQIRIAAGEKLSEHVLNSKPRGHVIECRINAEDPYNKFIPSPGKINLYYAPGGRGVRVDTHVYSGYEVPPYYDSMIAKLIVTGATREIAIARMRRALGEFLISGIKTTIPLQSSIMQAADFIEGTYNIRWLEQFLANQPDPPHLGQNPQLEGS